MVCGGNNAAGSLAQTQTVQPQPIYDQCAALTTGTAADDEVARAVHALKEKDAKARLQAAEKLGQSCDKRAVEPLIDLLKDSDPLTRAAAIEALGKLGDKGSVTPLIELIYDQDWRVRLALVSALASFKTFEARNTVVNGIANPSDKDIQDVDDMRVRCAAILTANQLKDVSHSRKSILFLYNFLNSSHAPIRQLAEQTMYALKQTRNGPTELIAIFKQNQNPELRRWSALWIGKLGIENGREVLQEAAANDRDPSVKQAANEALAMLKTGK